MDSFPNFETVMCSNDISETLKEALKSYSPKIKNALIGRIVELDVMPSGSALFLDKNGKAIALYKNGGIVILKKGE